MQPMEALPQALRDALFALADEVKDEDIPSLDWNTTRQLAQDHGISSRQVEIAALIRQVLPERYRRNHGTVGWDGQIRLLRSTVAVVGAGGLGGWVIEGLARMGVGHLVIIDGDTFEENNLNRQLGCTETTMGQPKAVVLGKRVAQVNSAVSVSVHADWLTRENATYLLTGADVVVDALDSLPTRFVVQEAARKLDIPFVHGAIAGYTGQVMTIFPKDDGLSLLYGEGPYPEHGVEDQVGNPSATPMMVSAWQIQQVVKLITGAEEGLLRNRLMLMDAQAGDVTIISLGSQGDSA